MDGAAQWLEMPWARGRVEVVDTDLKWGIHVGVRTRPLTSRRSPINIAG